MRTTIDIRREPRQDTAAKTVRRFQATQQDGVVNRIKSSREVQQLRQHRQVAVIERLKYVRQYFNNCCLRGVVRPFGRQTANSQEAASTR